MKIHQTNRQSGFIVGLAMLAIVILSFFMITGSTTMLSTVKVGGTYSRTIDVFNIAEVGIAKARPMIEGQVLSTLLTNYDGTYLIPPTDFGDGKYEVTIADNNDTGGDPLIDTDNIVIVSSVGRGATGGTVRINTHLQKIIAITTPPNLPGGPGAGVLCGANSQVKTQGAATISGCDYNLPGCPLDPMSGIPCPNMGCSGGSGPTGCNGTFTDPDSNGCDQDDPGGGYALAAENGLTTDGTGYTGSTATTTTQNAGDDLKCDDWIALSNQIASLPAGAPGVTILTGNTLEDHHGDCTNPGVFIINSTAPTFNIKGDTSLCGMLVVASNTSVKLAGTATIVGIVMVMGNNTNIDWDATTGTSNVFGQIITNELAIDAGNEIDEKGNAYLKYSSAAVAYAQQALSNSGVGGGGALLTVAWEEQY